MHMLTNQYSHLLHLVHSVTTHCHNFIRLDGHEFVLKIVSFKIRKSASFFKSSFGNKKKTLQMLQRSDFVGCS